MIWPIPSYDYTSEIGPLTTFLSFFLTLLFYFLIMFPRPKYLSMKLVQAMSISSACGWRWPGALAQRHQYPDSKDQHEARLGPTGPRWAPCWPHQLCCLCSYKAKNVPMRFQFGLRCLHSSDNVSDFTDRSNWWCFLNSKDNTKLWISGPLRGEPQMTSAFATQRASNA